MLPTLTPRKENRKVVQPTSEIAIQMFVPVSWKVTPVASASMLVATASSSMVLTEKEPLMLSSSFEKASRIMFAPISASRMNAIQWSKRWM